MRMLTFSGRNAKEILRDPLNLAFGLGFPLVLLFLMSIIQANIPISLFAIEHLAPGITVFGLSFLTLFTAVIISKDRSSALLQRLYTTPMTSADFILGYTLPMIPIGILQTLICYLAAWAWGLPLSVNMLWAVVGNIPVALFYISLGLLFGSILNEKQVGGISGALLTNLSAWLSGIWFDLNLMGRTFRKIAYALPFVHAVDMGRALLAGQYTSALPHLWWVLGYTAIIFTAAIFLFLRQMKKQ